MEYNEKQNCYHISAPYTAQFGKKGARKLFKKARRKNDYIEFDLPLGLALTSLLDELPVLIPAVDENYTHTSHGTSAVAGEHGLLIDRSLNYDRLPDETYLSIVPGSDVSVDARRGTIFYDGEAVSTVDNPMITMFLVELLVMGELQISNNPWNASIIIHTNYVSPLIESEQVAVSLNQIIAHPYACQNGQVVDLAPEKDLDYSALANKPSINGYELEGDVNAADLHIDYKGIDNKPTINNQELSGNVDLVEKQKGESSVYALDEKGSDAMIPYSETAMAGTLAKRDANGRVLTEAPTDNGHATNKEYVDGVRNSLLDRVDTEEQTRTQEEKTKTEKTKHGGSANDPNL